MTVADLFELLPAGAPAAAVVFVVVVFLYYQHAQDVRLNKISERCHDTQVEIQKGYQDSIKIITDAHLVSSQAVSSRLSSMEHNVSDLIASINQLVGKMK